MAKKTDIRTKEKTTSTSPAEPAASAGQSSVALVPHSSAVEIPTHTGSFTNRVDHLSLLQRTLAEELAQLDSQLTALYLQGLELTNRANDSGVAYLLAHVGRELSRGVVQRLVNEEVPVVGTEIGEGQKNERNRQTIGTILQLPSDHPLVTLWFQLNETFSRNCHYRGTPPNSEELCDAFLQFTELLYGRVAPYFTTHLELEQLLTLERPSVQDFRRVAALLTRPQLRRHFFSKLQYPSWLEELERFSLG